MRDGRRIELALAEARVTFSHLVAHTKDRKAERREEWSGEVGRGGRRDKGKQ